MYASPFDIAIRSLSSIFPISAYGERVTVQDKADTEESRRRGERGADAYLSLSLPHITCFLSSLEF